MTIIMMACTARGFDAMRHCGRKLKEKIPEAEILTSGRCVSVPGYEEKPGLSELTAEWFEKADALLFFTAAGIAVRCIAPFVRDKFRDPAVLVIDENARFVIPILSGHAGGANRLCGIVAEILGAQPVITTATDGRGLFAVDVFAAENGLRISDRTRAKQISARLLAGEKVTVFSDLQDFTDCPGMTDIPDNRDFPETTALPDIPDNRDHPATTALPDVSDRQDPAEATAPPDFPETEDLPERPDPPDRTEAADTAAPSLRGLLQRYGSGAAQTGNRARADIILSFRKLPEDPPDALYLIPRAVTLGIGCRKGIACAGIRDVVSNLLEKSGIFPQAVIGIATIDLKKNETGLLAFAKERDLPVTFYTAEELRAVPGEFTSSSFVREITGVDNVCERCAVLLAGRNGKLLVRKQRGEGVTAAAGLSGPGQFFSGPGNIENIGEREPVL
ncbi:MAG: cobalamin biosynthesis protein [Eubacteriales bacterium]|nr:cobalamin biosynthesis protein [Eubacteriales bacterium]